MPPAGGLDARAPVGCQAVDAYLAVVSKREVRSYADRGLAPEVLRRILEAGRLAGSSKNRQARRFVVLERVRQEAARCVFAPANVSTAALAVALVIGGRGPADFDAGRAAQNMILAAWNDGVGSCPNGIADAEELSRLLGLEDSERVSSIVSFGYPAREVDPARRTAEGWVAAANRKPFEEIVSYA
ncbi:MAG: hypothetical protein DLM64_14980 [Solirubrobacterales bacterium]|nr:MAG: hypothetical protein DLM64_14980 [Solirubrobacterales bacterium]